MFISIAHATTEAGAAASPDMGDAFMTNMGLILVMFILFYVVLIRPQQKRMKDQRIMLEALKKGDKVVTGGGLVGSVSKVISDSEVEVDLGNVKVVAMRYTLQTRLDDATPVTKPSNDDKPAIEKADKKTPPKVAAKKKATAKTTAKKSTSAKKAPATKKS